MAGNESGAVVVTGASTGIGRATALLLDREGYKVFAGVRKQSDAESLRQAGSDRLTTITIDVAQHETVASAREAVEASLGDEGLVGLVNNAGIGHAGPIEFVSLDDFREVLEVNVVGQVAVTQAFMASIRKAKGTVVFLASIGGRISSPFLSPYSASKFGVEALGEALRREVSPWGIDVSVVEPGSIATEIWRKAQDAADEQLESLPPEGRRLYEPQIRSWVKAFIQEGGGRGIPPEKVAEVIHTAIRSDRPKARYLVGIDAKVGAKLNAALPRRTFDAMVRMQYKQPKKPPAEA
jgi:NAD(P)-dependent dehydrogenase (short-subunit alcohol dehydrogenase family)